ncbi:cytochrome P450, family 706, subfamily A, polypeptide 2 [Actinidia rufa]|uniref:Cytochrome P450, family 706, subfamily A, polypeptide 2 n=1 Tax=Actinidia rufa TaxID=165716 RepID=A0A7J0DSM5_9ERIC|nr:cytochrome P450, family 706, subfamily A, polypeptide 2 [Actinidia rufa]
MFCYLASLPLLLVAIWSFLHLRRKNGRKLPPGPLALPFIGNLHMLGHLPHRSLQNLAKKYGPIMSMKLGSKVAIIVSSPEAAELFLKTHDILFASRPKIQASDIMSYGSRGLAFSEYGPYWRNVRRLCTSELLSVAKIDSYAGMRKEEVEGLVGRLRAAREEVVDVTELVERLIEDMTCRMVFGRRGDDRFDLKSVVREAVDLVGAFNVADFVPFLGPFDLQVDRGQSSTLPPWDRIRPVTGAYGCLASVSQDATISLTEVSTISVCSANQKVVSLSHE